MSTNRTEKPLKKARPADADSQRIVEAARAHFFSHGFRSVTMDDLAEELAMSKKTLYAHFPSKIALLEAVLADKFAGVEAKVEELGLTPKTGFASVVKVVLEGVITPKGRKT